MKSFKELSKKYFNREDQIEDNFDALMIVASNLTDIQVLVNAETNSKMISDKLDSLKQFIVDLRKVERQNGANAVSN